MVEVEAGFKGTYIWYIHIHDVGLHALVCRLTFEVGPGFISLDPGKHINLKNAKIKKYKNENAIVCEFFDEPVFIGFL